jgi:hypothetical protein
MWSKTVTFHKASCGIAKTMMAHKSGLFVYYAFLHPIRPVNILKEIQEDTQLKDLCRKVVLQWSRNTIKYSFLLSTN